MKTFLKPWAVLAAALFASFALADTYALCIGINDYPNLLDEDGNVLLDENGEVISDDLFGCVNDAKAYQKLLMEKFGVPKENIRMLLDKDANKEKFLEAIRWLLETAKPGDTVFFSYSGHGSQYEVDDQPEEEDGLEEVLVLYDVLVTDNFFADFNRQLVDGGRNATFVMDNCFAGGIDKAFGSGELMGRKWFGARRRSINGKNLVKSKTHSLFTKEEEAALLNSARTPRAIEKGTYIFLMGGQEDQTTDDVQFVDDSPPAQGIFSYVLVTLLMDDPSMNLTDAIAIVKEVLKEADFEQVPKIEASDSARPAKPLIVG